MVCEQPKHFSQREAGRWRNKRGTREEENMYEKGNAFHATTPLDLSVGWTVSLRGTLLQQRKTNYWRDKRDRKVQN